MIKIKLARFGKKGQPTYRVVIANAKKKMGKYLETIGSYNPLLNPAKINIDKNRFDHWLEKGAQPTKTVLELAKKVFKK